MTIDHNKYFFDFFFSLNNGRHEIIITIKNIFNSDARKDFNKYIREDKYFLVTDNYNEKDAAWLSLDLVRYIICRSISLRNVDSLEILKDEAIPLSVRFYALLKLLHLFNGVYALDQRATNSDFWAVVNSGRIDEELFLSFHAFNYVYHMGTKLTDFDGDTSNLNNILSMYASTSINTEEKILDTKEFIDLFIKKIIGIVRSNIFDKEFINFYNTYNLTESIPNNKESNSNLLGYWEESLANALQTPPLAVEKIRTLIDTNN